MMRTGLRPLILAGVAVTTLITAAGCRNHMPHALTWPASGDTQYTHPKPPEGGYYSNWDPYAVSLEVTPVEDVNPVRTQHYLIATVRDKDGKPLPNRRVEWIVNDGSVGDIVEVDESGWRASRGYKVTNDYAVSHTNNFDHVLDMGNDDPSDDITLTAGQTWCVITSPIEGDSYITAYAPGIYDRSKHKVFVTKHWYDVKWSFPTPATNPIGTTHDFVTTVAKYSDNTPLAGYIVTYRIVDGPAASFEPGGGQQVSVPTDSSGMAKVTLRQASPAEGTNNVAIEILRPENTTCCKPAVKIAEGRTSKTWIGPKISCDKTAPATVLAGQTFDYVIEVTNPSQVQATNIVITDNLPAGVTFVSSNPPAQGGQSLTIPIGSIPPAGRATATVTVKANTSGRYENCAEVKGDFNLSARCCATTTVVSPKLAIEKHCPAEVIICDTIEYVIVVRNPGDGVAKNVKVEDRLPEGIVTSDGRNSVSSNVGDLGPGESKEIRYTAKASRTGKFDNRAVATADGGLTAESGCSVMVKQPKLAVAKTGPETRYIGRPATYEITVTNQGDAPARQTVLTDPLPAGLEFQNASDGGQFSGGRVTWNIGTLDPGASKKVTITVKPLTAGSAKNTATATAVCTEASASTDMKIEGVPAILLEVVDVEDPIEVGQNITYIITVTNQGSADGTNIVVEATLPPEEDYVSAEGATKVTNEGKTVRFAPLPALAPKAKATYKVVAKGNAAGDVRFKISLKSDQMKTTADETESTHVY